MKILTVSVTKPIRGEYSVQDRIPHKRFTLTYEILGDNIDQTSEDIQYCPGLPRYFTEYNGAYCKSIIIEEDEPHACLWKAEAIFDSHIDPDEGQIQEDPTLLRPDWKWSYETEEEALEFDALDEEKPIVNPVEEPLIINGPVMIAVLNIWKYQLTFDPDTMLRYGNHANSQNFWGAPPKSCYMAGIEDEEVAINGIVYRKVHYVIKFKIKEGKNGQLLANTLMARPLCHGTKYKPTPTSDPKDWKPFEDRNGNPTTGNLKKDGTRLPDGDPYVFLEFNRLPTADLNDLNLGPWQ